MFNYVQSTLSFFQKNHRKGVAYMIFLLFLSRQYHIDIVFDFASPKEKGFPW